MVFYPEQARQRAQRVGFAASAVNGFFQFRVEPGTTNWELARGCIRGVLKETGITPEEIAAVSTTCMREGILLYDKDGNEIWACANVDARSDAEVGELIRLDPELEKAIRRGCSRGQAPSLLSSRSPCCRASGDPPCVSIPPAHSRPVCRQG